MFSAVFLDMILIHFSVFLRLTNKGQTCSDISANDLYDAIECSDAVTYATSFSRFANYESTGSWDNFPKGCIIYDSGNMYFNSHSTGISASDTRSICKSGN